MQIGVKEFRTGHGHGLCPGLSEYIHKTICIPEKIRKKELKMREITDEGYTILAEKILNRAATDLKDSARRLKKNPDDYRAFLMKRDCERFFRSDWVIIILNDDPERIIGRILEDN